MLRYLSLLRARKRIRKGKNNPNQTSNLPSTSSLHQQLAASAEYTPVDESQLNASRAVAEGASSNGCAGVAAFSRVEALSASQVISSPVGALPDTYRHSHPNLAGLFVLQGWVRLPMSLVHRFTIIRHVPQPCLNLA
jgi:hypothetical protein